MLAPALLAAYVRTRYVIPGGAVRIGRRSAAADRILAMARRHEAVLITAWNPRSRRMPHGWNTRRQRVLSSSVRRYDMLPAQGGGRGWSEDHLLVLMPAGKGPVTGRRFGQNAIVVLRRGHPARLVFCFG